MITGLLLLCVDLSLVILVLRPARCSCTPLAFYVSISVLLSDDIILVTKTCMLKNIHFCIVLNGSFYSKFLNPNFKQGSERVFDYFKALFFAEDNLVKGL